jgi:hypothetical protein
MRRELKIEAHGASSVGLLVPVRRRQSVYLDAGFDAAGDIYAVVR